MVCLVIQYDTHHLAGAYWWAYWVCRKWGEGTWDWLMCSTHQNEQACSAWKVTFLTTIKQVLILRSQLLIDKHGFEQRCGRKHETNPHQNQEGNQRRGKASPKVPLLLLQAKVKPKALTNMVMQSQRAKQKKKQVRAAKSKAEEPSTAGKRKNVENPAGPASSGKKAKGKDACGKGKDEGGKGKGEGGKGKGEGGKAKDLAKVKADLAYQKMVDAQVCKMPKIGDRKSFTVQSGDRKLSNIGVVLYNESFYVGWTIPSETWPECCSHLKVPHG